MLALTPTDASFVNTVNTDPLFNFLCTTGNEAYSIHAYEIVGAEDYVLNIYTHEASGGGSISYSYSWFEKIGDGMCTVGNTPKTEAELLSGVPAAIAADLTSALGL